MASIEVKKTVRIFVNERPRDVPTGSTVDAVRGEVKPEADLVIVNGFPAEGGTVLREGDRIALIRRGEIPGQEEMEALMTARHTPGVHACMKSASVGIAGLGGLGSVVALALGRVGAGKLVLADFDVVEPSNLNRQQYWMEDIGLPKTEAMTRLLRSVNPYTDVITHRVILDETNLPRVFKGVDVLVECLDRPEAKAMLIRAATRSLPEVFVVGASGVAGYGESNSIKTIRLGDRVYMVGDMVSAAEPGRGLMAPRVGIAAHHQANLAVSLLMKKAGIDQGVSLPSSTQL